MSVVGIVEAAAYLGVNKAWLTDAPIPRMDYRKPGGERAVWRWRTEDLDEFMTERIVLPGWASPVQ